MGTGSGDEAIGMGTGNQNEGWETGNEEKMGTGNGNRE